MNSNKILTSFSIVLIAIFAIGIFGYMDLVHRINHLESTVQVEHSERMKALAQLHQDAEDHVVPLLKKSADDITKVTNFLLEISNALNTKSGARE